MTSVFSFHSYIRKVIISAKQAFFSFLRYYVMSVKMIKSRFFSAVRNNAEFASALSGTVKVVAANMLVNLRICNTFITEKLENHADGIINERNDRLKIS